MNGYFSRGGHVRLSKSTDKSVSDVNVKVTLYTGRDELIKEVKLSAFDHEGQYAVQIERKRGHCRRPHRLVQDHDDDDREDGHQENCLVYNVEIEFPHDTTYFEDIEFHIKSAQRIEGGKNLEDISFGTIKAGLGRGAIIFEVRRLVINVNLY